VYRVFGVQVGDDVGVGLLADPEIVVGPNIAVEGVDLRFDGRDRRFEVLRVDA